MKPLSSWCKIWYKWESGAGAYGWRIRYQPYRFPNIFFLWTEFHLFLLNAEYNKHPGRQHGGRESNICTKALVETLSQMHPSAESFSPTWGSVGERRILTLLWCGMSPSTKNPEYWEINGLLYKDFGFIPRWRVPESKSEYNFMAWWQFAFPKSCTSVYLYRL